MGGIQRLFLRITPIIMLICFVCFGITHTFQQEGQQNITYLTQETINIGTEQEPNNITVYNFDTTSYVNGIDQNILKRSVEHSLDIQAYSNILTEFNAIWKDGYQFADGIKTIVNGLLLVVNTFILPINMILVPVRITAGLILTGMSLLGINIQADTIINNILNGVLDNLAIPFIGSTWNQEEELGAVTYLMQDNMDLCYWGTQNVTGIQYYGSFNLNFSFDTAGAGHYKRIYTTKASTIEPINTVRESRVQIWYTDTDNNEILVYDTNQNGWIYQNSKTITITLYDSTNENLMRQLTYYLQAYATTTRIA